MPGSFFIPSNYISMALSLILATAAVIIVSAMGKVGFRSYLVGFLTYVSSIIVISIAMTLLELVGLTMLGETVYAFVQICVTAAVETAALRFFMHVFLKRHTYAVFYGAGVGFAIGNLITDILGCLTNITLATMMREGAVSEEYAELYGELIGDIQNSGLVDCIADALYPLSMFVICMALAAVIGHAVRGEKEYELYAGGAYLAMGTVLTLMSILHAPAWLKLSVYILFAAAAVYAMIWSKTKYGITVDFNRQGDYHAPLGRHIENEKKGRSNKGI